MGALLFLHRMAQSVAVERPGGLIADDVADESNGRQPYDAALASDPDIIVYRISGAFFFGAAASVAAALDRIGEHPKAYVVDFSGVSVIDSTAAATIEGFAAKARRHSALVYVAGAGPRIRRELLSHGIRPPQVRYKATLAQAVRSARKRIANSVRSHNVLDVKLRVYPLTASMKLGHVDPTFFGRRSWKKLRRPATARLWEYGPLGQAARQIALASVVW